MNSETHVELIIKASGLANMDVLSYSDPVCVVYSRNFGETHFREIGRTEIIENCLDPKWLRTITIPYFFERRQLLKFHVFDWDSKAISTEDQDSLGFIECTLGEIMAHPNQEFTKKLSKKGTICIYGKKSVSSTKSITIECSGRKLDKKDFLGKSDPYLVISKSAEGTSYIPVHKTEVIEKTLNPDWRTFTMEENKFCSGDYDKMMRIECFDHDSNGRHDKIGECFLTVRTMFNGDEHPLINVKKSKKKGYQNSGFIRICAHSDRHSSTFLDYVQGGMKIHFTVAVDFGLSNGDPSNPTSLHYKDTTENSYQKAIRSVGDVIKDYDSDQLFPAIGFAARIPPDFRISHEFFLNGRMDSPYCRGIDGVLQAYQHSINTVKLGGPTNFTPVIRHVMKFASALQNGDGYFVLLIITDGLISDLQETKNALSQASNLPMSVIIVGVGKGDFSLMKELDGDKSRQEAGGSHTRRDIVQFVEMSRYSEDQLRTGNIQDLLARDVLEEIPTQVLSWMKMKGFPPKQKASRMES